MLPCMCTATSCCLKPEPAGASTMWVSDRIRSLQQSCKTPSTTTNVMRSASCWRLAHKQALAGTCSQATNNLCEHWISVFGGSVQWCGSSHWDRSLAMQPQSQQQMRSKQSPRMPRISCGTSIQHHLVLAQSSSTHCNSAAGCPGASVKTFGP
jgi:hypothetical protein